MILWPFCLLDLNELRLNVIRLNWRIKKQKKNLQRMKMEVKEVAHTRHMVKDTCTNDFVSSMKSSILRLSRYHGMSCCLIKIYDLSFSGRRSDELFHWRTTTATSVRHHCSRHWCYRTKKNKPLFRRLLPWWKWFSFSGSMHINLIEWCWFYCATGVWKK